MEPTWTKNGAKIESTADKMRANLAKSNFWNTRFYKTKLADLLPKSTPQPRGITINFKCDFDCTFLTSLARTRRRVLLLASSLWPLASCLWPGLGGTRVALKFEPDRTRLDFFDRRTGLNRFSTRRNRIRQEPDRIEPEHACY